MNNLGSLLIEREVATSRQIEEALARQALQGGDLATNLLELGAATEGTLSYAVAAWHGVDPAPVGELPVASSSILRLVPGEVALRHLLYPLGERGGSLRVAVAEPLPAATREDLEFALGLPLEQCGAIVLRVRQAIARDYGLPLDRRLLRLLDNLEKKDRGARAGPLSPSLEGPPAIARLPRPESLPPDVFRVADAPPFASPVMPPSRPTHPWVSSDAKVGPGVVVTPTVHVGSDVLEALERELAPEAPVLPPPPPPAPPPEPAPVSVAPLTTYLGVEELARLEHAAAGSSAEPEFPRDPPPPAAAPPNETVQASVPTSSPRIATPPPPPAEFVMEAAAATAAEVQRRQRQRAAQRPQGALAGWARRALNQPAAARKGGARRRGPLTIAATEALLEEADASDQALAVFFDFARQYFEYSALFLVHHDLAEGHDANGPGATRERVVSVGVPLDLPSTLAKARERKIPLLGPLARDGLDAVLLEDLGRTVRAAVLVLPVVVRGRTVALLYGDHGAQPVEYQAVGDVVALAPLLASALERIIVRKKLAAFRTPLAGETDPATTRLPRPAPLPAAPASAKDSAPRASVGRQKVTESETEPDWTRVPSKRGVVTDQDMVDEGWSSVPEPAPFDGPSRPKLSTALRDIADKLEPRGSAPQSVPRPTPHTERSPARAKGSGPVSADPPPPPTAAAVHMISTPPIPREDASGSEGPMLTVDELGGEDDESIRALLEEIDGSTGADVPFPVSRSSRRPFAPESEAVLSVDPRAPPSRREGEHVLPAVMVHSDLVDRVLFGGEDAEGALEEILRIGEAVIPAVFAKFPGPLTITRIPPDLALPRPADCGPLLRVIAAMRRLALPFLAVRSADGDPQVRFWATYLLGELHYGDACAALLPRLFDEHDAVKRMALRSARALKDSGEAGLPIREGLARMIGSRTEPARARKMAIAAASELRLNVVIPTLIDVLADPARDVALSAEKALRFLTGQDWGGDARSWRKWWGSKGAARLLG